MEEVGREREARQECGTGISDDGVLTLAADETLAVLTVKAVSGAAAVTVIRGSGGYYTVTFDRQGGPAPGRRL